MEELCSLATSLSLLEHLASIFKFSITAMPNYCLSAPCLNGGTCFNDDGGFYCQCPPRFAGHTCNMSKYILGCGWLVGWVSGWNCVHWPQVSLYWSISLLFLSFLLQLCLTTASAPPVWTVDPASIITEAFTVTVHLGSMATPVTRVSTCWDVGGWVG